MKYYLWLAIPAAVLFLTFSAKAEEGNEVWDGFSYNIRALVFANEQRPAQSTQNPDNAFLELYRYSGELHLRPDFVLDQAALSAVFKPRFISSYRQWEAGAAMGTTDSESRAFVNEWRVMAKPASTFFLSFGKEKLLWGPSFLASPSNVLFKDTEKTDPFLEVEGKYLARAIYTPGTALSVSMIAETQQDRDELQGAVRPLQALKIDVQGSEYSLSLIGYHRPGDRFRMGSYGQWTASDALVLYYDGVITKGTDALYPVEDGTSPLGGTFAKKYDDSGRFFTTATAGGAFTFLSGETLNLEFLYNGPGYNDADAGEYYTLRQNASSHFFDTGMLSGLSQATLGASFNNGLLFLRRYYVMGQYQVREIKNVLDIAVRYVHGLDERAGAVSSIVEWRVSDHLLLFNINTASVMGWKETEFNSIIDTSVMAGAEAHF